MNNSGSGLLTAILVVVIVLIVAAALFFVPMSAGPGGGTPVAKGVSVTASVVRNPAGLSAVVTVNAGTDNLRSFSITRLVIPGMGGGPSMPYTVGPVSRGGSVTVTIPFSGPAPAPNAMVPLSIDYTYKTGWFGTGAGSSGVTSVVP